jgi:Icc-related predicted phosphoesterase
MRVAAVGDLHFGKESGGSFAPRLEDLPANADVLVLTGDLTKWGDPEEAAVLAGELESLEVPMITVLGNHDYHLDRQDEVRAILEDAGVSVLEAEAVVVDVNGRSLGLAGVKGFGGGFTGACASDFGEPEMKAFVRHTKATAERLEEVVRALNTDVRIVLMHYSPIKETLRGEPPELYPFLGSYLLGEAVDRAGADIILHGHAHRGTEKGVTPGGIHVRNVAQPVINRPYNIYRFREGDAVPDEIGI